MKIIKALGLVVPVAGIAMVLFGSATAMAESTALCEADENPCESPVSHVHYAAAGKIKVVTSSMTYECKALLLAAVSELGSPQVLEGSFTYTSCDNGCTRTEENGPAVLQFLKTGNESGEAIGESLVHVVCGIFINCTYTLEGMTASLKGPLSSSQANGELTFVEQEMRHESGAICPEEAFLNATFVPLSPTYISS